MKKIALIVDIKGWAFDLAANIIKKELEDTFIIDIYYSKTEPFNEDLYKIIEEVKDYDIIHFFWRKTLVQFEDEKFKDILPRIKNKISTGIYDHLYIDDPEFYNILNNLCNKYVVSSKKLYDIYSKNEIVKNPWGIAGDTFDPEVFYPKNIDRFKNVGDKPLVIGWVGNSLWNNKLKDENGNNIDFKGFHTVLMPVIEELKQEGYNVETYLADKQTNFIPNDKMCDYYNSIDIYACVSISEGTPKPLLEAMGCAVPIITTDVGVADEYLGDKEKEFIIGEREIGKSDDQVKENLKNCIKKLYNNRELLNELSKENYENSKKCNSKAIKEKYKEYFLSF